MKIEHYNLGCYVGESEIDMPVNAKVLGVHLMNDDLILSALINPLAEKEIRVFKRKAWMCEVESNLTFVASWYNGGYSIYLFEENAKGSEQVVYVTDSVIKGKDIVNSYTRASKVIHRNG